MTELTICTDIKETSGLPPTPPLHFSFSLKLYLNFKKLGGFSRPPKHAQNCQSLYALLGNLHTAKIQMPSSVLQNIKTGI